MSNSVLFYNDDRILRYKYIESRLNNNTKSKSYIDKHEVNNYTYNQWITYMNKDMLVLNSHVL